MPYPSPARTYGDAHAPSNAYTQCALLLLLVGSSGRKVGGKNRICVIAVGAGSLADLLSEEVVIVIAIEAGSLFSNLPVSHCSRVTLVQSL